MLTNWLGKWFGGWFGASAPSSPGAMSGAATVGIAASAGLTASGVMSGAAALSISSSGSIGVSLPGADDCWGASWGGTWGVSWGYLEIPYQELSLKGQVFVRSYLTSIHSVEVVEQIVSVAAVNNISVIDAEVAVTAKHQAASVESVRRSRKAKVEIVPEYQPRQEPKAQPVAIYRQQGVVAATFMPRIDAATYNPTIAVAQEALAINAIRGEK